MPARAENRGIGACRAAALSEKPLALVQDEGGRLVMAAVNGAAAAAGLVPGLPLADGRALVIDLQTAAYAPEADARALAQLAIWCGRYTPWCAPDPTSGGAGAGLLFDITGCAHLFGGEATLLADLTARLARFGYRSRAALADTQGAAWALARFACDPSKPWCLVPPGGQQAALAPLPPAALRLSPAAAELLARFGLRDIGALLALPPAALAPRFGSELARRLRQALGDESEPLSPLAPVPSHLVRRVLAEPIMTIEALAAALGGLAAALCRQLDDRQQGARRLTLTVYRVDGTLRSLTLGTSRPTRDPEHLARLFAGRLEAIDAGFGIEVVTLAAPRIEPLSALQLTLGSARRGRGAAEGGAADLAALLDRLGARFGLERVARPLPQESHLPERAVGLGPALGDGPAPAWRRGQPRPLRLLACPEAIEAVALLPDHPPARFRWRRLQHQVLRAEGPERIEPEWWRPGPGGMAALPRDYFRVEDSEGRRYWLYRSGARWFLHGLFG